MFFSKVTFLCWPLLSVRSTRVFPQWHAGLPAKSTGVRLHVDTHAPFTPWSWSGSTMPLFRHSEGTYQERAYTQFIREHSATVISARWASVDWPGVESGISARKVISTKKKRKKSAGGEWVVEHSPKSSQVRKKPLPVDSIGTVGSSPRMWL